jgi:glycosyltransferase involved in cell wall biosynthesis
MNQVHFFIDNLNIGGFQRLCLDQAYAFSEMKYSVAIHSLSELPNSDVKSFLSIEGELLSNFRIKVESLPNRHIGQIASTRRILQNHSHGDLIISHSLRATVVIFLASLFLKKRFFFTTQIHQLPTLSAPVQRFRRFVYAQLSPILVAYSEAVKKDWDSRVINFPTLIRWLFRKPIRVVRNGIYLNRIPDFTLSSKSKDGSRLIFLGRNTGWKGISTFLSYAEHPELLHFKILLMLPNIDATFEQELIARFGSRLEITLGRSIASFTPEEGDVHFYAAQYGGKAKFIESISLNCLEMAAAGVPSVVTSHGLETWSDLVGTGIFFECDWTDIENTSKKILEASKARKSSQDLERIRSKIDIKANIHKLIETQSS